jgi:Flagellar biosynthesis protein, FliO
MFISRNFSFSNPSMFQLNPPNSRTFQRASLPWGGLSAFLKRLMPLLTRRNTGAKTLEHLESLPLTAQSSLALIRLYDETLLLGITPHSITLLTKGADNFRSSAALGSIESSSAAREGAR